MYIFCKYNPQFVFVLFDATQCLGQCLIYHAVLHHVDNLTSLNGTELTSLRHLLRLQHYKFIPALDLLMYFILIVSCYLLYAVPSK